MGHRIAIDATPLLYPSNGIGRMTRTLIAHMLALPDRPDLMLFGRRFGGAVARDWQSQARFVRVRLPRAAESMMRRTGMVEALCRAHLYHATDFYLPLRRPERAVATIHDVIFLQRPEAMVDHTRLAKWVPAFARRCRAIVTVSECSKRDIVQAMGVDPERVHVTYLAVDHTLFRPEPDPDALRARLKDRLGLRRPYFLAVSCSTGRKNTPLLLEAYVQLLRDSPLNDLVLVWDPPPELRQRFSAATAAGRIHFVGRQTDEQLRDLYAGATAMVYPSLYEGFGLPVLEAMSCGTPVITSCLSSLPEVGGDAAVYVDPHDKHSVLGAMEAFESRLSEDLGLRRKSIVNAARFTWERCARETIKLYEQCLDE
jgi:glycosyltransferase involved in cell wall biosynthesis